MSKADENIKSVEVKLHDKTIEVKTLTLGGYSGVLRALANVIVDLFQQDEDFENMSNSDMIAMVPDLIDRHLQDVALIIETGTRKEVTAHELLHERAGFEAVDLLAAILQVNDIMRMVDSAKKLAAGWRKPTKASVKTSKTTA